MYGAYAEPAIVWFDKEDFNGMNLEWAYYSGLAKPQVNYVGHPK